MRGIEVLVDSECGMVMGKGMGKDCNWDAVCMMGSRRSKGGCCELGYAGESVRSDLSKATPVIKPMK